MGKVTRRHLACKSTSSTPWNLHRIDEIRPPIAQLLHLLLRLAFGPIIPPASPPLLILLLQQKIHQHAPAEQEYGQIGQHDAVALAVQGAVLCLIDIRGDGAVEVAPADDEAHCDAAFVHAFGVVGGPDDDVGDAGVNAQGGEKGAGVADSGGGSVGWLVVSLIILVGSFRVGSDLRVDGG